MREVAVEVVVAHCTASSISEKERSIMVIMDLEIDRLRPSKHWKERHERLKKMVSTTAPITAESSSESESHPQEVSESQSPEVMGGTEKKNYAMEIHLYEAAAEGDVDKFINALERFSAEMKVPLPHIFDQLSYPGNTFLHVAASYGHEDLAGFIVHHFRDLLSKVNHKGDTPLHLATRAGRRGVVEILVRFRYHLCYDFFVTNCSETEGSIITVNEEGNTPLHEAMMNGRNKMVDYFVEFDAVAACCVNKEGKSPLYLAVEAGNIKTVKTMFRGLKTLRNRDELPVTQGMSLIHAAILGRNQVLIREIVDFKPTLIDSKDENGQNPLHFAASIGFLEGVRQLLNEFKMNAFERDKEGFFPVQIASKNGFVDVIEVFIQHSKHAKNLLQHYPDSNEFLNPKGHNVLHVAAKNGKDKMVKYILSCPWLELLINERDKDGNTPLHLATFYWHPKVVSSLTWDVRVNVKILNSEGLTALEVAEEYMETMPSYRKRLTWMALMSAGVPRAKHRNKAKLNRLKSTAYEPYNMDYCKDRVNTLLLVSTLVATVTFAAGFTAPGGYNNSEPRQGMATMASKQKFHIFVVCDTIAMYSSILVAVTLIWAQLGDLNLVFNALRLAIPLLGVSLSMMSLAFMVSIHLVVSNIAWLANFVLIMGIVSVSCLLVLFVPLYLPYTSKFRVLRHICYFPFCLLMLASGSYDDDHEQMEE